MDELVKRLRAYAGREWYFCHIDRQAYEMIKEAADAIEKLQQYAELYKDGGEVVKKAAETYKSAYIAEHDARVAELPRWIPVTERLPREDGFTLIFTAHGHVGVCYFTNGWWGGYDRDGITHWMPLPQPPKEE